MADSELKPQRRAARGRVTFTDDLLDGRRVAMAGGGGVAILEQLRELGAWVDSIADAVVLDEDAAAEWVSRRTPLQALVVCAAESFGSGGADGLRASLQLAWLSARAVAGHALIESDGPGKLVFVAPRPDAGPHAEAARSALENLARTLSTEWARFTITAVTIAPGSTTTERELADLVGFLVSGGGEYLSGCRLDLGAVPVALAPGC
jgi:NAD(P)-dependent dehydrogenase (short-subunit alcohol dehydrogenase family)